MSFIDNIKVRARKNMMTIVLPESEDRRTYEAAAKTLRKEMQYRYFAAKKRSKNSEGFDITNAVIVDPNKTESFQATSIFLVNLEARVMTQLQEKY